MVSLRNKVGGAVEEKRVGQFDCMVAGRASGKE